jgi:zinc/manganese transport system permease protein
VGFYVLFACVVTVSVQLVGVYLVFATLIVPPLATRRAASGRLYRAWGIGLIGYVAGIGLSAALDIPTGPLIVWTLVVAGTVHYAVTPTQATDAAPAIG